MYCSYAFSPPSRFTISLSFHDLFIVPFTTQPPIDNNNGIGEFQRRLRFEATNIKPNDDIEQTDALLGTEQGEDDVKIDIPNQKLVGIDTIEVGVAPFPDVAFSEDGLTVVTMTSGASRCNGKLFHYNKEVDFWAEDSGFPHPVG